MFRNFIQAYLLYYENSSFYKKYRKHLLFIRTVNIISYILLMLSIILIILHCIYSPNSMSLYIYSSLFITFVVLLITIVFGKKINNIKASEEYSSFLKRRIENSKNMTGLKNDEIIIRNIEYELKYNKRISSNVKLYDILFVLIQSFITVFIKVIVSILQNNSLLNSYIYYYVVYTILCIILLFVTFFRFIKYFYNIVLSNNVLDTDLREILESLNGY